MIALDLNTLELDGAPTAVTKALAELDKKIALVELFDARFRELCAQQIDQSDESVDIAFRQAHLDVYGKAVKAEPWTPEVVTTDES